MTKICITCKEEKEPEDFCLDKTKIDGRHPICKKCKSIYDKRYWPIKIKRKYNLDYPIYLNMFEKQKGRCAICKSEHTNHSRNLKLGVDHCHSTNVVRGLLCHDCNIGIGAFKDNPAILKNAIKYLREYSVPR